MPDKQLPSDNPPPLPDATDEVIEFDDWSDGDHDGVGEAIDEGKGRIFPCESCGADLKFHIGEQNLKCPYCGFVKQIELDDDQQVEEQDYHAMLEQLRQWHDERAPVSEVDLGDRGPREVRCESCGGNVTFVDTLTSTSCPYCASPIQLDKIHKSPEGRIPADGVLPFLVERTIAHDNLAKWVDSRWFAPNKFRRQGAKGDFNGVYLSYFTFDSMTFTRYSGSRGEHYYVTVGSGKNRRTVRRTRWYPASGRFQRFFDDILVLANTGLRRDFMLKLEPWPLNKVVPFNQQMLAGHFARTYDIELDACFAEARQRIDQALYHDVCHRIGGDTQRVDDVDTRYEAVTFKHLLLPTWLLAYTYADRTYQVFINASTGEVQGERPWSVVKILFAVLTAGAIAAIIAVVSGGQ